MVPINNHSYSIAILLLCSTLLRLKYLYPVFVILFTPRTIVVIFIRVSTSRVILGRYSDGRFDVINQYKYRVLFCFHHLTQLS